MHEQLHAPSNGSGSQPETGPANPFPGVKPFGPEHRSVFFGRHRDVAGLREMISDKSFRAGVVYGEAGVGKTSCLRAGLVSQLQAAGLHAIYLRCRSNLKKELADRAMDAGATPAMPDENVADYVVRLGRSLRGGLVLLLDDVADLLAPDAPKVDAEPLLRLVSRLGGAEPGSAKVLFCVDSDEYHLIAELQRRAHVTIAPSSIYHLAKLDKEECTKVIEQAALASGIYFEAGMAALVAQDLTQQGPASPLRLQITMQRAIEKNTLFARSYLRQGGSTILALDWLRARCREAGGSKALVVLSESADRRQAGAGWTTADELASATGLPVKRVEKTIHTLGRQQLIETEPRGATESHRLRQPGLIPLIRRLDGSHRARTAAARLTLRKRLTAGGLLRPQEMAATIRYAPRTVDESSLLKKSRIIYLAATAAGLALACVAILVVHLLAFGGYHLSLAERAPGMGEAVVVAKGRPGYSSWTFFSGTPPLGSTLVDTGIHPSSLEPKGASRIASRGLTGSWEKSDEGSPEWFSSLLTVLHAGPRARLLIMSGKPKQGWKLLADSAKTETDLVAALEMIVLAGSGSPEAAALIAKALRSESVEVRRQAVEAAAAQERRRPAAQIDALVEAASDPSPSVRSEVLDEAASLPAEKALVIVSELIDSADTSQLGRALDLAALHSEESPVKAASIMTRAALGRQRAAALRAERMLERLARAQPKAVSRALTSSLAEIRKETKGKKEEQQKKEKKKKRKKKKKTKTKASRRRDMTKWLIARLGRLEAGELDPEPLTPLLLSIARSDERELAAPSMMLAARIAPPKKVKPLLSKLAQKRGKGGAKWRELAARAYGELVARGKEVDADILRRLAGDRSSEVQAEAITSIGRGVSGQRVMLMDAMSDRSEDVRAAALVAMAATNDKNPYKLLTAIRKLVKKGSARMKAARVRASAKLVDSSRYWSIARFEVIRATRDKEAEIRRAGVEALAEIAHHRLRRAFRHLRRRVDDSDAGVRRALVDAMARISDRAPIRAIEVLSKLAADKESSVATRALDELIAIVARLAPEDRKPDSPPRGREKTKGRQARKPGLAREAEAASRKPGGESRKARASEGKDAGQAAKLDPKLVKALSSLGSRAVEIFEESSMEPVQRRCMELLEVLPRSARPEKLVVSLERALDAAQSASLALAILRAARRLSLHGAAAAVSSDATPEVALAALDLATAKNGDHTAETVHRLLESPHSAVRREALAAAHQIDLAGSPKLRAKLTELALSPKHPRRLEALAIVAAHEPEDEGKATALELAIQNEASSTLVARRAGGARAAAARPSAHLELIERLLADTAVEVRREAVIGLARWHLAHTPAAELVQVIDRRRSDRQRRFAAAAALAWKLSGSEGDRALEAVETCSKSSYPLSRALCRAARSTRGRPNQPEPFLALLALTFML
jgi:hypothetical protein